MLTESGTKFCRKCSTEKLVGDFYPHPKQGLSHKCKDCVKRDMQALMDRLSPEERRERNQRDSKNLRSDPERLARYRAYHRAYGARFKDEINEYAAQYRASYRTDINAKIRAWRHTPRGSEVEYQKRLRRRAKLMNAQIAGSHTYEQWEALKAEHDHRCVECYQQEPAIKLTKDHIIPLSYGGSDDIGNIQPLCRRCNSVKRNTLDKYTAYAHVTAGKLTLDNPRAFASAMHAFRDGLVVITISPKRRTRTTLQLAYYWGVVLEHLSEHTGYTPDELHELCKQKFIPKRLAVCDGNGVIVNEMIVGGTTTSMNTIEFGEYMEEIRRWAAETLGVVIPDPDPDWRERGDDVDPQE